MRTVRTAVAALAMAGAIGGAIAAGQTTKAPTVYIDNGTPNPIQVDLADLNQPGGWQCTLPASTPCYFEEFNTDTKELSEPSENGNYSPL